MPIAMHAVVLPLRSRSLLASLFLLGAGCAKDPAPDAAPSAAAPAVTSKEAAPLKVAFAFVGPVGDAGWTFAHDQARRQAEAAFPGQVKTSFVENVGEGADAERVFRDMVEQGNALIFGTSFGHMEPLLKVAADSKGVKLEHASGYKTAENLRTYDARTFEGAYLAGVIAGAMTKTKTLGVVGSIPIPEVIRNIDSFTLGAQSVNPGVRTKVAWVGKWYDPPKETEAAQSLLDQGADVLMQSTGSAAPLQTAERAGKMAIGWGSDMSRLGPKAHLASVAIDWAPYYKKAIKDALDGTWKVERSWWGFKEGAMDVVNISDQVPAATRAKVEELEKGLSDGTFTIWKGPIKDQAGKEVLKAGETGDEKMLLGVDFYVKGVDSKLSSTSK